MPGSRGPLADCKARLLGGGNHPACDMLPVGRVQSAKVVFGEFELDEAAASLSRLGVPVEIRAKPLALLAHLISNRDRVVSKAELLETVWSDVCVSDQALWSAVRDLRRALRNSCGARMIQTVRGRGFRFVVEVASAAPRVCPTCGAKLPPFPQNFPKSGDAKRRSNGSYGDRAGRGRRFALRAANASGGTVR